jgi:hypothetical protein
MAGRVQTIARRVALPRAGSGGRHRRGFRPASRDRRVAADHLPERRRGQAGVASMARATQRSRGCACGAAPALTRAIRKGKSWEVGGDGRNRTGVHGFAVRCVTTPPRRQPGRRCKRGQRHRQGASCCAGGGSIFAPWRERKFCSSAAREMMGMPLECPPAARSNVRSAQRSYAAGPSRAASARPSRPWSGNFQRSPSVRSPPHDHL